MPKGTSTAGAGFFFDLPENVKTEAGSGATAQALMADGKPLPAWLKFDSEKMRFEASAVPDTAFPIDIKLNVGQRLVTVIISERSE